VFRDPRRFRLPCAFVIENRHGANGISGTESVVRAAPDGHTLVMSTNAITINPARV
jgi:tripartite-type tricarboxylate transporter receptor subunit TctC